MWDLSHVTHIVILYQLYWRFVLLTNPSRLSAGYSECLVLSKLQSSGEVSSEAKSDQELMVRLQLQLRRLQPFPITTNDCRQLFFSVDFDATLISRLLADG